MKICTKIKKKAKKMDTTNIVFILISVAIIAFNTYVFYKGYKDLQRRRQELKEYKEQMLAEIERFQIEAERLTKEARTKK
jgi:hypothetical protein